MQNPITSKFNQFFIDLAPNNHKDWFDANRSTYENEVKKPFENLVEILINEVNKIDARINPKPKDCIFRINRDIRFSKDKTPYKMNRSAVINVGGRKNMSPNGFYLEMGPEYVRVYGGLYSLSTSEINQVRTYIAKNDKAIRELQDHPDFINLFGEIRGEQSKRLPKELAEKARAQPLLFHKQWYYFSQMPSEMTFDNKLVPEILKRYKIANELNMFFEKALK